MVRVTVPATTANFGSGFDCLGAALNMYNIIEMQQYNGCKITSTDSITVPTDESNLIYSSAKMLFDLASEPFVGLKIVQTNSVPLARGLGSSSACIAGGLLGANALLGERFALGELINIAAVLEGHPDNSTPALTGGFIAAVLEEGRVHYHKSNITKDLLFVAVIPNTELKTVDARVALPKQIPHSDAVYNLSRSAILASCMATGNLDGIGIGVQDKLHQNYRLPLIPHGQEIMAKFEEMGALGAYISGAGSTLMALAKQCDSDKWQRKMRDYLDENGLLGFNIKLLQADNIGARVEME